MSVLDVPDYHEDDQRFPSPPAPAVAATTTQGSSSKRRKEATQAQVRRRRRVPHHPRGLPQLPEHIQPARDTAFSGCTTASPPTAHSPSVASGVHQLSDPRRLPPLPVLGHQPVGLLLYGWQRRHVPRASTPCQTPCSVHYSTSSFQIQYESDVQYIFGDFLLINLQGGLGKRARMVTP